MRNTDQQTHTGQQKRGWHQRRGAIVVFSAFLMIMMLGMLAFSVDLGYMYTMESQLQRSVDAAALAGAGALVEGEDDAEQMVAEYLVRNPVGRNTVVAADEDLSDEIAQFLAEHEDDLELKLGHWDADTASFSESDDLPSSISVTMTYPNNPLFFARFLGNDEFSITAQSIAMYQPRDIMVVLDFSGSMNDDTEFKKIPSLGRDVVEANLLQCWEDLGSPTYGNMTFEPQYITVQGNESPDTWIEYRYKSIYVTADQSIWKVKVKYSNNRTRYYYPNSTSATIQGSGSTYNKWIKEVTVYSGNNSGGDWYDFDSNVIDGICEDALGLDNVPYPYNSGSWDSYIDWCQSSYEQNDDYGGYRWKFGYMSLMVYWLSEKPRYTQTADLWKVSAQPVTALKTSTDAFMDFIQEVDTDDQVGLVIYNGSDGDGYLEEGLTQNFQSIKDKVSHRQAGHYHSYTNIGGGLREARQELVSNARPGSFKMVVLMTDGIANWSDDGYGINDGEDFVVEQAQIIADLGYPILTVSLGSGADTALMQQVADMHSKGRHFNIPGGQTGDEYYDALIEVFREIAKDRPLKLVK